jgi:hypothetical protein
MKDETEGHRRMDVLVFPLLSRFKFLKQDILRTVHSIHEAFSLLRSRVEILKTRFNVNMFRETFFTYQTTRVVLLV